MQLLIIIAVFAYFLFALGSVMDKHIVSNTPLRPVAYAFYSGFFQILYVIALPVAALASPDLVLKFPPVWLLLLTVLDGVIFVMALVALYKATQAGEISRIAPIVGIAVPIFTFILSAVFLKEVLTARELTACVFFVLGGFLMSAKIDSGSFSYIKGMSHAVCAGFLFAVYYVLMDYLFNKVGFLEVFIIMQFGGFVGALLLLIPKKNRKEILHIQSSKKRSGQDGGKRTYGAVIFLANKIFSAIGSLLLNFAIALGSVTIINSLQAVQYVFVLLFTLILSRKAPHFFDEETHKSVVIQKGAALLLTAVGLILVA